MDKLYRRETYLKKLRPYYDDTEIVKFITGVMGCGKSTLIEIIIEELREKGIKEENIISINFNKRPYKGIKTADKLIEILAKESQGLTGEKYLFLDELQNVEEYERALNACYEEKNFSIFATSSNGYLLSPKHTRRLMARYISYEMFTLSFDEYLEMKKFYGRNISVNPEEEFTRYMMEGGFPETVRYEKHDSTNEYSKKVLENIFEKVVRKNKRVKNRELFFAIEKYIINNYGTTISIKDMQESLTEELNTSVRKETLYNYIQILEDSRIVYRCDRFSMTEKRLLKGKEKYYLADPSFYFAIDLYNTLDIEPSLENVIYNYARMRDYAVAIGRVGKNEVDFIMEDKDMDYVYVQVANHIITGEFDENGKTREEEKEYKPLENIRDSYPKYVMTLDRIMRKRNGIKHKNIVDFIKEQELF